ncbi:MAG: hypothetical protein ACD_2C00189G0009 [uncultured bacterium (gcode 4)]|uniref:Uncharacterized protein n=1 Tax=uncultured bacterium (gcode 4) TaxID=1234023 RepID=K2H0K1_9BACT|nr:MAG: hypothetical protein ACD_2C00189G0009 [uncultured bacterium (gcode 4)]
MKTFDIINELDIVQHLVVLFQNIVFIFLDFL